MTSRGFFAIEYSVVVVDNLANSSCESLRRVAEISGLDGFTVNEDGSAGEDPKGRLVFRKVDCGDGPALRAVFEEQRWGMPFEEALLGLGDRVDLPDVRILITAILVQREVGGNLAEILEKVSATMRVRFTVRRQVRVYTAQGRLTGYILAAMPILLGLAITALNPEYMAILFEEPMGKVLIAAAAVLQFLGFLLIRRIIDIEI